MNRGNLALAFACASCTVVIPLMALASEPPVGTEKITKEAQETIEATKQYTAQQKEAFQRKAHQELVAIQKQIMALREKATEASASTREELKKSLSELEKKRDTAKNKLDELKAATDAKWNEVKTGVSSALDELKNSYRKALSRLP